MAIEDDLQSRLPTFLATPWKQAVESDGFDRERYLKVCLDLLLRTQCAIAIADYLSGKTILAVEELIETIPWSTALI